MCLLISIFIDLIYIAGSDMYRFQLKQSLIVMGQLAQNTARTLSSKDNPPLKYVDRTRTILNQMSRTSQCLVIWSWHMPDI